VGLLLLVLLLLATLADSLLSTSMLLVGLLESPPSNLPSSNELIGTLLPAGLKA
jgi:hypothetical protein